MAGKSKQLNWVKWKLRYLAFFPSGTKSGIIVVPDCWFETELGGRIYLDLLSELSGVARMIEQGFNSG